MITTDITVCHVTFKSEQQKTIISFIPDLSIILYCVITTNSTTTTN